MTEARELPLREVMDYDAVIVGAGPVGLAAAIRLKQIAPDSTIVVAEKSSEIGAHILSGVVVDPIGLDKLLPGWREDSERPLKAPVTEDKFYLLGPSRGVRLPNFLMPPLLNNHGDSPEIGETQMDQRRCGHVGDA
jgi:electron-transferring-flavoprotein dehydrogenase